MVRFTEKFINVTAYVQRNWKCLVHRNLDDQSELIQIKENVPKEAQVKLKNLASMEEVWCYLDDEYGTFNCLAEERVTYLRSFQPSKAAVQTLPSSGSCIEPGKRSV